MTTLTRTAKGTSLSELYLLCLEAFGTLLLRLRGEDCHLVQVGVINPTRVDDEYGRVKIWGEQSKAYLPHAARGSLDDTLRNDEDLKGVVEATLLRLGGLLSELSTILTSKIDDDDTDLDQESINSFNTDTDDEMMEADFSHQPRTSRFCRIWQYVLDQVAILYELSSLLRRPTIEGRWLRSAGRQRHNDEDHQSLVKAYRYFDEYHVVEKFRYWRALSKDAAVICFEDEAVASAGNDISSEGIEDALWLCQRLVMANGRRREQLRYWQRHPYGGTSHPANSQSSGHTLKDRLSLTRAKTRVEALTEDTSTMRLSEFGTSTAKSRNTSMISKQTFTTATLSDANDQTTEDDRPRTVYASTATGGHRLNRVPDCPIPKDEKPFVSCPYCGTNLSISEMRDRQKWKRHVFRDLRPYSCTFEECQNSTKLYTTRDDWIYHELQIHRRQYACPECNTILHSKQEMIQHLTFDHQDKITQSQIPIVLDLSSRPIDDLHRNACVFCGDEMAVLALRKHIAKHMEDIALFVLPHPYSEEGDEDSNLSVKVGSRESSSDEDDADSDETGAEEDGSGPQHATGSEPGEPELPERSVLEGLDQLVLEKGEQDPVKVLDWTQAQEGQDDMEDPNQADSVDGQLEAQNRLSKLDEELIEAVKAGNEEDSVVAISKGANSEAQDEDFERTSLLWAAERGHASIAKLLLSQNAKLETVDMSGQTALSLAARNGHEEVVQLLVDAGAVIDSVDNDFGQTPLSWACERGNTPVVRILLGKGADPNSKDKDFQQSCLSMGAENGHLEIIKMLVDHGADIYSKDTGKRTPLSWAASNGHEDAVRLLRKLGRQQHPKAGSASK